MMNDFLSAVMLEKPSDVFDFAAQHFSTLAGGGEEKKEA